MGETPMLRSSRLETDVFCGGCGYNLHGQDVWPDERLDILVCRCPECGRHHPAGVGTSASSVWLKRLGTILLIVWVIVVISAAGALTFALGALQAGYVGTFTYDQLMTADGRAVEFSPVGNSGSYGYVDRETGKPIAMVGPFESRLSLRPQDAYIPSNGNEAPGWSVAAALLFGSLVLGVIVGMLLATALWHWPRWRYAFGCVLPLLACSVLTFIFIKADQYQPVRRWAIERCIMIMAIQCVGVLIGTRVGRPLSRAVARMVVPPKPRMLLAFLWTADGLALLTTRPAEGRG